MGQHPGRSDLGELSSPCFSLTALSTVLSSINPRYKGDHIHSHCLSDHPHTLMTSNSLASPCMHFEDQILHPEFSRTRMSWRPSNSKCLKLNSVSSTFYQNASCSRKPALADVTACSSWKPRSHSSLYGIPHIPAATKKLILAIKCLFYITFSFSPLHHCSLSQHHFSLGRV